MARKYNPEGPHPFGYTLAHVPLHIAINIHPLRAVFTCAPEKVKGRKSGEYVVDPHVLHNWVYMINKYKAIIRRIPTDGFPVLLSGKPMGMNEAGRLLNIHPATLRRKFEKGIVEVRGHSFYPDEVVLDFCYEQLLNDKRRSKR